MFGAIAGGIASALAGGAMSKLFGGGQKAASGGIQGDVLATDNNTRSEERFSRNAETDLVCRLLLEKKKHNNHKEYPHQDKKARGRILHVPQTPAVDQSKERKP